MAKPDHIILVRHGESEGNVNRAIYARIPDYAVKLTEKGKNQALEAGQKLRILLEDKEAAYYVSPFHRTRQTFAEIAKSVKPNRVREDPRLREQEWSGVLPKAATREDMKALEEERDAYGTFYYRFAGGESAADVYDRISTFLDTLHRDFEKEDFPEACIIVTHGMTLRVFLMRWFSSTTIEEFELLANPENCCRIVLKKDGNKYKLCQNENLIQAGIISKLRKYDKPKHPYQMPI